MNTTAQDTKKTLTKDPELKALAKRAGEVRGRSNAVAPITVSRVRGVLGAAGKTPEQIVKSFATVGDATSYAGGDKAVDAPTLVKEVSKANEDPFGRGRGLVAVAIAMREASKTKH